MVCAVKYITRLNYTLHKIAFRRWRNGLVLTRLFTTIYNDSYFITYKALGIFLKGGKGGYLLTRKRRVEKKERGLYLLLSWLAKSKEPTHSPFFHLKTYTERKERMDKIHD